MNTFKRWTHDVVKKLYGGPSDEELEHSVEEQKRRIEDRARVRERAERTAMVKERDLLDSLGLDKERHD